MPDGDNPKYVHTLGDLHQAREISNWKAELPEKQWYSMRILPGQLVHMTVEHGNANVLLHPPISPAPITTGIALSHIIPVLGAALIFLIYRAKQRE
jgi:hypothetical protein